MQDFKDKLAVITGGASGVGRSLAFAIGAEGGKGDEAVKKSYDDYIFGLSQNVQYDRFIIRGLKKK